jgi:ATP-dependent Lhr-like helicase
VKGYRREWLDELTLSGEIVWARLWGQGSTPVRTTPMCLVPREDFEAWAGLATPPDLAELSGTAARIREVLQERGAVFTTDLQRLAQLPEAHLEMGLSELAARGLLTCDSYAGLRWLLLFRGSRRAKVPTVGRWSLLPRAGLAPPSPEFVARQLLRRTGVVFRRTLLREKQPVPWRDLVRVFRTLEARGEIRGGRFVAGFDGEQYALPQAIELLRAIRRSPAREPVNVAASDPLNFRGILTPDERVSPIARQRVTVG